MATRTQVVEDALGVLAAWCAEHPREARALRDAMAVLATEERCKRAHSPDQWEADYQAMKDENDRLHREAEALAAFVRGILDGPTAPNGGRLVRLPVVNEARALLRRLE